MCYWSLILLGFCVSVFLKVESVEPQENKWVSYYTQPPHNRSFSAMTIFFYPKVAIVGRFNCKALCLNKISAYSIAVQQSIKTLVECIIQL